MTHTARYVTHRMSSPLVLSTVASYDAVSIICLALPAGKE